MKIVTKKITLLVGILLLLLGISESAMAAIMSMRINANNATSKQQVFSFIFAGENTWHTHTLVPGNNVYYEQINDSFIKNNLTANVAQIPSPCVVTRTAGIAPDNMVVNISNQNICQVTYRSFN